MRVNSLCQGLFLLFLLFEVSTCNGDDKTIVLEVVGTGDCADCKENNFKASQAFSGLHVTIDCKLKNGDMQRIGASELDEEGKFKISLPKEVVENGQKLKKECYAQLHSAAAVPCPAHNGLEASKIVLKSQTNDKITFGPTKTLQFSTALCTSKFLWPYPKFHHPWKKHFPKVNFPPLKNFGHPWPLPPFPPLYKPKPLPPPVPIYKPPIVKPLPPIYKPPVVKSLPPPIPIYKPKPKLPVYKPLPPPVPIYKPKPKPPVYKPPVIVKPLPPPIPVYKPKPKPPVIKPLPPTIPIYKPKPKPPVYKPPVIVKPLPPLVPIHKPLPPFYKKPCPPLPKLPHVPIYKPPVVVKPLPPPIPIYKPPVVVKPLPPPVPIYKPPIIVKPLPPPVPIYKPLPPFYKKPCPPLPKLPPLPKIPPKYFHHPKFGYFPPLPPSIPHA